MEQLLIPRQFAHQPILQSDPPSTNGHDVSVSGDAVIRFCRFCVLPQARQLLVDGQPVELGSRAFDQLMVLIGAPGTLITKKEIMSRVWSDRVVEESNLKVQMSALRRILNADQDVIKTVHGRGYVFTGEVNTESIKRDVLARPSSEPTPPHLGPALPTSLSGWGSPRRAASSHPRAADRADRDLPVRRESRTETRRGGLHQRREPRRHGNRECRGGRNRRCEAAHVRESLLSARPLPDLLSRKPFAKAP
jgi:DNA-binding winged helix-turn-helix (wHTH) protein